MSSVVCVVVDTSRIVREGLAHILAKSPLEPACIASSIGDVPSTIAEAGEQILVLTSARERSGLANEVGAVKAHFPDAQLVVVGDANQCDLVTAALALGVTSFVDENVTTSNLVKELELVARGEPVISVLILNQLLGHCCCNTAGEETPASPTVHKTESPDTQQQGGPNLQLSGQEAAILRALTEGASNKGIASKLSIAEATVKVHVKAILRKIRVKNRTQAATWALRQPDFAARLGHKDGRSLLSAASLVALPSP